jgi:hypothetical protein
MRAYYCTKKRINAFIEVKLKQFDSLNNFRVALEDMINECNDTMVNQKRFYSKVLNSLDF